MLRLHRLWRHQRRLVRLSHFYGHNPQRHQLFTVFDYTGALVNVEVGIGVGLNAATDPRVIELNLPGSCCQYRREPMSCCPPRLTLAFVSV
jgi:hypothetical protein